MSENQEFCSSLLALWAGGWHHLPKVHPFGEGVAINWAGDLSTFDGDGLTRLVLLAHEHAVRIEIASSGPRLVKIIAHRRSHDAPKYYQRHPDLQKLAGNALGRLITKKTA